MIMSRRLESVSSKKHLKIKTIQRVTGSEITKISKMAATLRRHLRAGDSVRVAIFTKTKTILDNVL